MKLSSFEIGCTALAGGMVIGAIGCKVVADKNEAHVSAMSASKVFEIDVTKLNLQAPGCVLRGEDGVAIDAEAFFKGAAKTPFRGSLTQACLAEQNAKG
ncbi:hypothetical protein HNP46_005793 [Pseudomonas nitritireducens]|uniref:Lipoprotein n=1 Tax=Pseudomonas nitroreducens TaxID=46680 RepID=A0A7W7P3P9_PSENT|nr:hypothetical protein [Pseudomonas nitritireducens]MBB4866886.1 hypothetical protein [Pseudomonas nitritireducens]